MANRRDFFKTVAAATAGFVVSGRRVADADARAVQAAPPRRREVMVAGRRVKVVDVHRFMTFPFDGRSALGLECFRTNLTHYQA